jgi:hypothetical protein
LDMARRTSQAPAFWLIMGRMYKEYVWCNEASPGTWWTR